MTPESPQPPRQEMEARLTALLLGELSAEDAASVRDAIAQDAELARLHERLKQTIGLVRETVASPADGLSAKPDALKLSTERREKLLQHFKTKPVAAREPVAPRRRWQMPWFVPMSAAAALMLLAGGSILLPPVLERVHMMEQVGEPAGPEGRGESDQDGIGADESRRNRQWFGFATKLGEPEIAATATPPPPVSDLSPAPALPAEPKPQSRAIALPEAGLGTVNVEARFADVMEDVAGKQVEFFDQATAQGGTAPAKLFGGFASGIAGGSGSSSDRSEKRELAQVERPVVARDQLATFAAGDLAPLPLKIPAPVTKGIPESLPSSPHLEPLEESLRTRGGALVVQKAKQQAPATAPVASPAPVAQSLAEVMLSSRGEPAVSGPVVAANPTPAPARRKVADSVSLERSLSEGIVANGVAPTETVAFAASVADPAAGDSYHANTGATSDAGVTQLGLAFQKSLDEGKKTVVAEKQLADRSSPTEANEIENLGAIAGKPVAGVGVADGLARFGNDSRARKESKVASLGDTPALGRMFRSTRELFDDTIATPAKPASGTEALAKNNQSSFGLNVVNGSDGAGRLSGVDSGSVHRMILENRSADFGAAADGTGTAVKDVKVSETASANLFFSQQDLGSGGRAEAMTLARTDGRNPAEWDSSDRFDAKERMLERKGTAVGEKQSGGEISKGNSVQAGGVYSVNAVGFVNGSATNSLAVAEPSDWSSSQGISQFARSQWQDESLLRQQVEIALPKVRSDEGRPVGERAAGRYLASVDKEVAKFGAKSANGPVSATAGTGVRLPEISSASGTPKALLEIDVRKSEKSENAVAGDAAAQRPASTAPIPQPEIQSVNNAFSTFSLNVSDVSFKLAAASLEKGAMPDPSTVRSEEFINAFDYRDPEPTGAPIAFAWERARYPFAQNRDLLRLSVKTAAAGRQPGRPLNLVLLLDNSGSMERADRVRIIQQCLRVLAGQLRPEDRISVVTFARTPRLWVDGLPGNQAAQVAETVAGLTPQGGTNLEEAMNLAYQTARRHYLANGINRVVLLTDGAANLGDLQPESLKKKVESFRKQGIALDCFGIGWDGYNDDLLEVLSRNGDGRYGFVNTPEAAYVEFAGQLAGALKVAASDVKVQVEFNPKRVTAYRQIGYAKHQLKKEQFRDNTVDAAEIGAAEAGNALYAVEVYPRGEGPLAVVRVRYKVPGTADYRENEWTVPFTGPAIALDKASPAMRLAATASAFSEWLVASPFAAEVTPDALLNQMRGVPEVFGADARPKKLEWMIRQAKSVAGR